MPEIHPTAVIQEGANIGVGVVIGPFCVIGAHVTIGPGTHLHSHVVIDGHTTIGSHCRIYPFAAIGTRSQDLKWKEGNICYTSVGDHTIIRELVTIHAGTDHGTWTKIGSHCALLAQSHVAHNCEIGNHTVLSHGATLAGHVIVEDHCNIGGLAAAHQFCRIGRYAMLGGMAKVTQDVLPYTIAEGAPAVMRIVNKVGMQRNGFTEEQVRSALEAYKILFMRGLSLEDAQREIAANLGESSVAQDILNFIPLATRGLARPETRKE